MTKETISETAALKALLSETADHQILAEMLGFVADRLMALDVDQLCGAGVHERSAGRVNHRNGYRPRRWETRAGTVDVQIPKLRKGTYFPEFLEPRRASEKAMTAVIQEAYIQGVSTRSVGCQSRRKKGPFAGVKVGQLRCRALLGVLPIKLTRDKAHVGQGSTSIKFRPGSGSGVSALF